MRQTLDDQAGSENGDDRTDEREPSRHSRRHAHRHDEGVLDCRRRSLRWRTGPGPGARRPAPASPPRLPAGWPVAATHCRPCRRTPARRRWTRLASLFTWVATRADAGSWETTAAGWSRVAASWAGAVDAQLVAEDHREQRAENRDAQGTGDLPDGVVDGRAGSGLLPRHRAHDGVGRRRHGQAHAGAHHVHLDLDDPLWLGAGRERVGQHRCAEDQPGRHRRRSAARIEPTSARTMAPRS